MTVCPKLVNELVSKNTLSFKVGTQPHELPPEVSDQWLLSLQLPELPIQYRSVAFAAFKKDKYAIADKRKSFFIFQLMNYPFIFKQPHRSFNSYTNVPGLRQLFPLLPIYLFCRKEN